MKIITVILFGFMGVTAFSDEYRTFTDLQGREIQAKIIKVDLSGR